MRTILLLISINNFGEKRLHYVRSLVRINKLVLIRQQTNIVYQITTFQKFL